jgi:hypothetical protein
LVVGDLCLFGCEVVMGVVHGGLIEVSEVFVWFGLT